MQKPNDVEPRRLRRLKELWNRKKEEDHDKQVEKINMTSYTSPTPAKERGSVNTEPRTSLGMHPNVC